MTSGNIFLPIRSILHLRRLFREERDLDQIKWRLRLEIDQHFTNRDVAEKYYDDLEDIFKKIMNMSLEDILYSCAAELFNKNVMVNVEYK